MCGTSYARTTQHKGAQTTHWRIYAASRKQTKQNSIDRNSCVYSLK
jgi:hypothetical protein